MWKCAFRFSYPVENVKVPFILQIARPCYWSCLSNKTLGVKKFKNDFLCIKYWFRLQLCCLECSYKIRFIASSLILPNKTFFVAEKYFAVKEMKSFGNWID